MMAISERLLESDSVEPNSSTEQTLQDEHQWQCQGCKEGDMVVVAGAEWTQAEREAWVSAIEESFTEQKFGKQQNLSVILQKQRGTRIRKRKSIMPQKLGFRPWPDATIRYCFLEGINQDARNALEDGMAEWTARTCLRFEEHTGACPENGIVTFQSHEKGCWAHAGYSARTQLQLNLGERCRYKLQHCTNWGM